MRRAGRADDRKTHRGGGLVKMAASGSWERGMEQILIADPRGKQPTTTGLSWTSASRILRQHISVV